MEVKDARVYRGVSVRNFVIMLGAAGGMVEFISSSVGGNIGFSKTPEAKFNKMFTVSNENPAHCAKVWLEGSKTHKTTAVKETLKTISQTEYPMTNQIPGQPADPATAAAPITKPKKEKKAKAAKPPATAPNGDDQKKDRTPAREYGITPGATLVVGAAPKETRGVMAEQFKLLAENNGKTVDEFLKAGGERSTLRRAYRRGFLTLTAEPTVPAPAPAQ